MMLIWELIILSVLAGGLLVLGGACWNSYKRLRVRWLAGGVGPWCGKCDYPLTRLEGCQCPECGKDLGKPGSVDVDPKLQMRSHVCLVVLLGLFGFVMTLNGAALFEQLFEVPGYWMAAGVITAAGVWSFASIWLARWGIVVARGYRIDSDVQCDMVRRCLVVRERAGAGEGRGA